MLTNAKMSGILLALFMASGTISGCLSADANPEPGDATAPAEEQVTVTPAAVNDSFNVSTTDGCGRADFVDFGPGAPGGGDNDDYIVIHDFCSDGHGVKVWAWLNGVSVNGDVGRYNGNGLAGDAVVWDPFKALGNVDAGDSVGIKVCLVDSSTASSGLFCREMTRVSTDG